MKIRKAKVVLMVVAMTTQASSFQLNPLRKNVKPNPAVKHRHDYNQPIFREDMTKQFASPDKTSQAAPNPSEDWSAIGSAFSSTARSTDQPSQQVWNQGTSQNWSPPKGDTTALANGNNYATGLQIHGQLEKGGSEFTSIQQGQEVYQQDARNGGSYGNKGATVMFEDNYSLPSSLHQAKVTENRAEGSGNIAAAAGTIAAAYASPDSNAVTKGSSYNSADPYVAGSFKSLSTNVYTNGQSQGVLPETLGATDSVYAAGSFGGGGSYGGASGSYGGSSHSGSGDHSGNGGEKGNVVYTIVPDGGSSGAADGGDTHSHLLSAIIPLFLLSTIFLPLGVSIGTAAAASSTSGRKRRGVDQTEMLTGAPDFLMNISRSEAIRVHQEMTVRHIMCSGLADESNHCLERLACLEASPDVPVLSSIDSSTLRITVKMLMDNEYLPAKLRDRLQRGSNYGKKHPTQCQRKFICRAPTSLPSTTKANRRKH